MRKYFQSFFFWIMNIFWKDPEKVNSMIKDMKKLPYGEILKQSGVSEFRKEKGSSRCADV